MDLRCLESSIGYNESLSREFRDVIFVTVVLFEQEDKGIFIHTT